VNLGRFPRRTFGKVAGFTVLSLILTVGLGVKIGNLRLFAHTYNLSAQFSDASGVFKGDAVKLAGVDVGRVKKAYIDHGLAVVEFNVNDSVKLTTDSTVAIRWRNVLGQRFLYVYPGSGRGRPLLPGDMIPVSRTEDAADIGAFLNKLGPILQAINPDKANAFLDAVNTALAGNEGSVRGLLTDASLLTSKLGQQDQQIKTLISSSDTVMSTYAAQNESIAKIIDDLNSVGGRLQGMTGDINTFITDFADVQQQLDRLMTDQKSNIDFDLQALGSVAGTLNKDKANLATTLCSLPPGVAPYFQTTSWGEWFNVRIVKFSFKDSHGNTVASANELDSERSVHDPNPVFGCPGSPKLPHGGAQTTIAQGPGTGSAQQGSGSTGSSGGTGSGSGSSAGQGGSFQDLQSYVDALMGPSSASNDKRGSNG